MQIHTCFRLIPSFRKIFINKFNFYSTKGQAKVGYVLGAYENKDENILTEAASQVNNKCSGGLTQQLNCGGPLKGGASRVLFGLCDEFPVVSVVGLGEQNKESDPLEERDETKEAVRSAVAAGCKSLSDFGLEKLVIDECGDGCSAGEGASLSLFRYQELKSEKKSVPAIQCFGDADKGWSKGLILAEGQNIARRLMEMPGNILTPSNFAQEAVTLLEGVGVTVHARTEDWAKQHNMNAFLSVAKGSTEPPKKCSLSVGTLSTAQAVTPVTPVTPKVVEDARVPTPLVQNLVVTETPSVLAALLQNRASSSTFMSATPMSATSMSATPKSATSMSATSKSIPPKSIPLLPQDFCTTTLWVDEHTIISTANPPEVCKATPRAQKDNARQSAPTPTPAPASVEEFPVALDKVRGPVRPKQSSDVSILRERSRRDKTKNVVAHTVEDSDSDVCIIKEQILKPTKKKKQALLKRRRAAHQCTQCSFKTFSISQLKSHEELHPTGRKIKCSKCPFETRLKSCMIYHASIHSGGKKFRCSKCSFKTNVLDLFVAHEALKHTCSVCHSEFHLRREFLRHITEAHRILRARFFVCRKCAFNSVDFTKIQKHKATHLGDQTVTVEDDGCVEMEDVERGDSIANNRGVRKKRAPKKNFKPSGTVKRKSKKQCAFNSVDFTKIQRHKASHLGNQTVTVEDDWCVEMEDVERGDSAANNRGVRKKRTPKPAKKNFKPSGTVKRKCKKQKPNFLKCHDCPFKCLNQTLMVKHRINKHLIPNPSINFNKKTDEYQCSVCSYVTDEKLFFVKHLRSHSQSPDPDDCSETQRQVEIFRCSFCDFETEFEKMMQSHLSTHSESDSDFDMDIPVDPDVDFSRPPSVCSGDSDPKTKTNQKISKKFTCVNCKFETNLKKRFKKHRSLHLRETVFNMVFTSIL